MSANSKIRMIGTLLVLTTAILAVPALPAAADNSSKNEVDRIENAIRVLQDMGREADKGAPGYLLKECCGIAILPDVIKAAFVIGGRTGKGVLLVKDDHDGWTSPCFLQITGGSAGWQIGVQSADLILVFRTKRSIENFAKGKFTLGADAGVAAGPLGRQVEASTDSQLKAEILSYSRSRGLFVGLSLQGASLHVDAKANSDFYGRDVTSAEIFSGKATADRSVVGDLKNALNEFIKKAK